MGESDEVENQENGECNGSLRVENDKDSKSWTTFASISDIQKQSKNWSLAADAGLLEYLQGFSHQLISRTHEIEKHVDQLIHETKVTSSKVNNIINDFLMLSNTQFIENRVYDEDIQTETPPQSNKQEEQKTKEQREAELIPQISRALALGLEVIDKAFDQVEIQGDSDSEDEEGRTVHGESLLEPKDPYLHRPLPHVIGSESFYNDDTVGLFDLIRNDIESESDQKEYDSGEDSTDESFEEPVALEKKNTPIQKEILHDSVPNFEASSDSESSDMFGDEAEYISGSADSEEFMESEKPNNVATTPVKKLEPEPEEDESEDLFSDVVVSNKHDEKPSFLQSGPSKDSLFDDDDNDSFEETSKTKEQGSSGQRTESVAETISASPKHINDLKGKQVMIAKDLNKLLQSSDDDLFTPKNILEKAKSKDVTAERTKSVNTDVKAERTKSFSLFDDDDEDDDSDDALFASKTTKSSIKSETSSNILVEEDEFEDSAVSIKPAVIPSQVKSPLGSKPVEKETGSLFMDDTEDDLFDNLDETKKSPPQQHPIESPVKLPEATMTEKKLVQEKTTRKSQPNVFSMLDDDDDDDDLFSLPKKETQSKDTLGNSENKARRGSSLFEDDDLFKKDNDDGPDVDLFATKPKADTSAKKEILKAQGKLSDIISETSKPQRKVPVGGVLLFGSADIFGKAKTPEKPDTLEEVTEPVPQKDEVIPLPKVEETTVFKSTDQISVSFDHPVDTSNTLSCAAKGRAKIQTRRRPPSRKGRQTVPATSEKPETSDAVDSIFGDTKKPEPILVSTQKKEINVDILTSPSTEEDDIFPMSDPASRDIFSSTTDPKKDISFTDSLFSSADDKKSSKITDDIFDDDIFSIPVTKSIKPVLSTSPDDIFAEAAMAKESSLFSSSSSKQHQSKISDIFSESEDIFSSPPPVKPATTVTKKQPNIKQVKRESDIFDDPLLGFSND